MKTERDILFDLAEKCLWKTTYTIREQDNIIDQALSELHSLWKEKVEKAIDKCERAYLSLSGDDILIRKSQVKEALNKI